MKRIRLAVNLVTGLLFLVQGLVATAAMRPQASPAEPAAAAAEMTSCHHHATPDAPRPRCCQAGCPGAAFCASAHVAISSAAPLPAPARAASPPLAAAGAALPPPRGASLLRPPIALHG